MPTELTDYYLFLSVMLYCHLKKMEIKTKIVGKKNKSQVIHFHLSVYFVLCVLPFDMPDFHGAECVVKQRSRTGSISCCFCPSNSFLKRLNEKKYIDVMQLESISEC